MLLLFYADMCNSVLLEVRGLFRTATYLLVSIYRFHMLTSVLKAATRLEFPAVRICNPTVTEV